MKATVFYDSNRKFEVEVPPSHDAFIDTALAYVWDDSQGGLQELFNRDSTVDKLNKQGARLRSSMVGDLVQIGDKFFMVDGTGWKQITKAQFEMILSIPERDRIMGWNWLQKYHSIGLHIQNVP